jgi:CheY-like chemotaxis protein
VGTVISQRVELAPGHEAKANRTVLVVEDEVLVRLLIADKLRKAGYTVVEAVDANEALDVLAHSSDVKLVLTDVQMAGSMDGIGLSHVVRSVYPAIKIVLTSGRTVVVDAGQHDGFFPKPCDFVKLVKHLETLLN